MTNKLVYCKNCKWSYWKYCHVGGSPHFTKKTKKFIKTENDWQHEDELIKELKKVGFDIDKEFEPYCDYCLLNIHLSTLENQPLNKNNNCKYYKRKWWKFWIKK